MTAILPLAEAYRRLVMRDSENNLNSISGTVEEVFLKAESPVWIGTNVDPIDLLGAALKTGDLTAYRESGRMFALIDINDQRIDIFRTVVLGKLTAMDYRTDDREIFLDPDAFAKWMDRLFSQNSHTAEEWLRNATAKGGPNPYGTVKAVQAKMIEVFKISEKEAEALWRVIVPKDHPWRKRGRRHKLSQ